MSFMKKFFALLMMGGMLTFMSCGGEKPKEEAPTEQSAESEAPVDATETPEEAVEGGDSTATGGDSTAVAPESAAPAEGEEAPAEGEEAPKEEAAH